MILRLILKAILVAAVLPALGLLAFHGGVGGALLTALGICCAYVFSKVVLFPMLATFGLASVVAGGIFAGGLGVNLMVFAIRTGLYVAALWIMASMFSSIVLFGLWPTVGAAALLAIASQIGRDE